VSELAVITPEVAVPSEILGEDENFLIYGEVGTGKTFTAGTSPEPQWWLTPGGKNELKVLYSPKFLKKHGRKEVFVTAVREDRESGQAMDNPNGYDRICMAVDGFLEENERAKLGVKTIIVDNATVLEEYMLNKAIQAEYHMSSDKAKTALKRERDYGIRKPYDSTWGGAQSLMDKTVNWLKELPFHLVLIAHTYEVNVQIEGTRERKLVSRHPLFVGQQRTQIPNKFDNVWLALTNGGGRSQTWGIQSERDQFSIAKTRVGGILDPDYERDVNISEVIAQFKAHAKTLEEE